MIHQGPYSSEALSVIAVISFRCLHATPVKTPIGGMIQDPVIGYEEDDGNDDDDGRC